MLALTSRRLTADQGTVAATDLPMCRFSDSERPSKPEDQETVDLEAGTNVPDGDSEAVSVFFLLFLPDK